MIIVGLTKKWPVFLPLSPLSPSSHYPIIRQNRIFYRVLADYRCYFSPKLQIFICFGGLSPSILYLSKIRHALGLDRIAVEYYSWRSNKEKCAQIDMIIERADRLINLCEIKYTSGEYTITAAEDEKVRKRTAAFIRESKTKGGILPTWITPFGLYQNEHSAQVQYQVTLDDLFEG